MREKESNYVRQNSTEVLQFLKDRFPIFHLSNVFFRDMHYGIRAFLQEKGMKVGYGPAEDVTREFVKTLEEQKILVPVDRQTWTLNYPEFKKPQVKAAEPAKPAPRAPAAPSKPPTGDKTS